MQTNQCPTNQCPTDLTTEWFLYPFLNFISRHIIMNDLRGNIILNTYPNMFWVIKLFVQVCIASQVGQHYTVDQRGVFHLDLSREQQTREETESSDGIDQVWMHWRIPVNNPPNFHYIATYSHDLIWYILFV